MQHELIKIHFKPLKKKKGMARQSVWLERVRERRERK